MTTSARSRLRELALVALCFSVLTVCLTYPLAFRLQSVGRADNGDGQFALWNVSWVARTLAVDPIHVFDANIFHPHRRTLAYSEANLGAGLIAMPAYWLTASPYAAYNFAVLASFVLSGIGAYYCVRYLFDNRLAAAISAIAFAYSPYLFGHIPHIQLLMVAGLPFSLLAFHRVADGPTPGRGAVLGLTMAAQAVFCAYYGIFAMLMVGYAVLFTAFGRRLWRDAAYWKSVTTAAVVAIVCVIPVVLPYVLLHAESGFERSLDQSREYSATWRMYLASGSFAHRPIMAIAGSGAELLFPGIIALVFGAVGALSGWFMGGRRREIAALYLSIGAFALWLSFGPDAGLYRLLYATVPGFSFMRAPSRFGPVIALALSVLAGLGVSALLARRARPAILGSALALAAIAELIVPLRLTPAIPVDSVDRALASFPRGPVVDLPIYSHQFRFLRAKYMLNSTAHWNPIVVAYSDYTPKDFLESVNVLADFPSRPAFKRLERDGVRYAVFHLDQYSPAAREALHARLKEFEPYLRPLQANENTLLCEIVGFPS